MRLSTLALLVFAILGPLTVTGIGDDAPNAAETQLILEIKLSAQSTDDSKEMIRSNPTMVVTVGQPFQFHVGGKIPSNHGGDDLLIGTRVRGKVNQGPDDEYRLALSIGLGNQSRFQGDDADVVRTDMLDIRTTLAPQKTKRFRYSADAWCNISLQLVPAQERPIPSR